jgi:glycosyltransferase involved in cell wall biosynthesis
MGLIVGQVATPSLVSLQGQVRDYAEHFFDGLSIGEIARDTIRPQSVVRGVGLVPTYLSFRKSIASEERILESAHYFTGRTHFDREAAARVNPDAKYFHCDRVLRSEFYEPIQELRPQGSPVVYATGSSAPRKGIGLLLDAVADVVRKGHSDVKLRVSGSIEGSPMWPMLQKRVARLGLEGRVEWLGPLDAASVRRELLACTVFVHPAWMDNSPNALAEAMMCETACIASTAGGIPSMVRSGEDGLLFECGNAEDLSSALQRLLDDEGLRARLGAAAKRTADQRHDPALIAAVTMDTYATILSDIAEQ